MPFPVTASTGLDTEAVRMEYAYSGENLIYVGKAMGRRDRAISLTVTAVSTAASASVSVTAHGLGSGNAVTIAGATGDWAGLNGTHVITVTGANAFTVAVNSSAFTGTFDGTITTFAPQTNATVWQIQRNTYTGTQVTRQEWAEGTTALKFAWDSRASYAYQ